MGTMLRGTETERNNMLLAYGVNYALAEGVLNKMGDFGRNEYVKSSLTNFAQDRDFNKLQDAFSAQNIRLEVQSQFFGLIENRLSDKIGVNLPKDTVKNIYNYATKGEFINKDFGKDFVGAQIGGLVDKQLGLPSGTTKQLYDAYKQMKAGTMTKGSAIALAINLLFGKQLAELDQKLGLPPGSMSAIITACLVGGPIAWAMAAVTVVFGFSKTEYQMSCINNYWDWCKETEDLHAQWAQKNVRQLIEDMLLVGEKTGDNSLIPTMIGTFRQEDVDYFQGKDSNYLEKRAYSVFPVRGIRGVHQSDYMKDFVHIGY